MVNLVMFYSTVQWLCVIIIHMSSHSREFPAKEGVAAFATLFWLIPKTRKCKIDSFLTRDLTFISISSSRTVSDLKFKLFFGRFITTNPCCLYEHYSHPRGFI